MNSCPSSSDNGRRGGFTLTEVLLAVALMGSVLVAMLVALSDARAQQRRCGRLDEQTDRVRAAAGQVAATYWYGALPEASADQAVEVTEAACDEPGFEGWRVLTFTVRDDRTDRGPVRSWTLRVPPRRR